MQSRQGFELGLLGPFPYDNNRYTTSASQKNDKVVVVVVILLIVFIEVEITYILFN